MATVATTVQRERLERRKRKLATYIRVLDAVLVICVGALIGIAVALTAFDISFLF